MGIHTKLYSIENTADKYDEVELLSDTIVFETKPKKFYDFKYYYSETYALIAIEKGSQIPVNCHIDVLDGSSAGTRYYCRLSIFQRYKLSWMNGNTQVQKKFWDFAKILISVALGWIIRDKVPQTSKQSERIPSQEYGKSCLQISQDGR